MSPVGGDDNPSVGDILNIIYQRVSISLYKPR